MSRPYPWTSAQRRIVRTRYGTETLAEVCRRTGLPPGPVWRYARDLGLTARRPPRPPGFESFIRKKHAAGWPDTEIARRWNSRHPKTPPVERHLIGRIRKRLGLPTVGWSTHRLRIHKRAVVAWLAANGYRSMGDIRSRAFKQFVASRGWSTHLMPRHVQVLDYLWEHGPATRLEIASAIGMSTTRGQRHLLSYTSSSRKTRGSYIADLLHDGLVERSSGRAAVSGPTKCHRCYLYWVAPGVERKTKTKTRKTA